MALFFQLIKVRITALVALSALTGYALAGGDLLGPWVSLVLGTLLLAAGAAAINQVQERHIDKKMVRTRLRPLPSGRIQPESALIIGSSLLLAGSLFLSLCSWACVGLGWLTVVWYNGIYTPLKRRSGFAAVVGAVIGALPPAIGWLAVSYNLASPPLIVLMMFLFLWQVPHFWLLALLYPADYARAGLPDITQHLGEKRLLRISFSWIVSLTVLSMGFPLFGLLRFLPVYGLVVAASLWLCAKAAGVLFATDDTRRKIWVLSTSINFYALVALVGTLFTKGFHG